MSAEMQEPETQAHDLPPWRAALSWRLLLAWTVTMLIPTAIMTVPLSKLLGDVYDFAARGDEMAHKINPLLLLDASVQVSSHAEWMAGALTLTMLAILLLSPFCAGLAVASYPARPRRFFSLLQGAVGNYPRMFRVMIVSMIPFGVAGGLAALAMGGAGKHAEKALLASSATTGTRLATAASVVLLVLAQLTVEAARAQMAADVSLRSGLRAWGRGLKMIAARPGAVLGRYAIPTVLSLLVAVILVAARIRIGSVGVGFVVTQLSVAAIGWGRAARILALANVARGR